MRKNFIKWMTKISVLLSAMMICACAVGPDYVRPKAPMTPTYKEAPKGWKIAEPQDCINRGDWWTVFNDPELNSLEDQLNNSNQSIIAAAENYKQALALVDEARASYFPTIVGSAAISRQQAGTNGGARVITGGTSASGPGTAGTISANPNATTSYSAFLSAAWEPDIWGGVRRTVEASKASAESLAATVALTRLSSQASLAQFYFELRGVDADQRLLDSTVADDEKALQLTKNQYASGVAALANIVQAQSQLEAAQALAINNQINRALYEHAIAILIGVPPAALSLPPNTTNYSPPPIPVEIPSALLERRPDIAQAERLVAQANAQIGEAEAAYFPVLNITSAPGFSGNGWGGLFALPNLGWSIGSELSQTIFNGGLTRATVAAARANYCATVANYRETVLTAFQNVEDNLATLRILNDEMQVQNEAAESAELALQLVINQYKSGTADYASVIVAQVAAYTAEKNAADINYLRMSTAVALIKALGGGWDTSKIPVIDSPLIGDSHSEKP